MFSSKNLFFYTEINSDTANIVVQCAWTNALWPSFAVGRIKTCILYKKINLPFTKKVFFFHSLIISRNSNEYST